MKRSSILKMRTGTLVFIGFLIAGVFMLGVASTFFFLEHERIEAKLNKYFNSTFETPNAVTYEWSKIETSLLTLDHTEVSLVNVDGSATGGAIEPYGNTLVYASANGHLATLNLKTGLLSYSDVRVPMDYDRLRQEIFAEQINFNQNWYRVHDIMVESKNADTATLYVSHHKFDDRAQSICNVISRRDVIISENGMSFEDQDWSEIFRLDDCIKMQSHNWNFYGHLSGGQMLRLDNNHMLISVGEFGLANFIGSPERVQANSGNQLAKFIKLNTETGETSIYATGTRNAQGLVMDPSGRIWGTEHAAKGGDELNLIKEGHDYGWPNVALGTEYGAPRRPLPLNPIQGRHDGYTQPVYAFVPSIGISGLTYIKGNNAFNLWKGDLIAASLVGETLYRMRPEDDRIVYAEPIHLGARLRDIELMDNGWIAVLTGSRSVIFLRDAAVSSDATTNFIISGYDATAPLKAKANAMLSEYTWGRDLFRGACSNCHRIDGEVDVAPPLNGIVGKRVGSFDDYSYSASLKNSHKRWSKSMLKKYIEDPNAALPGTRMTTIRSLDKYEQTAIIDYLAGTSGNMQ